MGTDAGMWWSVISLRLIVLILVSLIIGILAIIYRFKYVRFETNHRFFFVASAALIIFVGSFSFNKSHLFLMTKYPINIYYSLTGYCDNRKEISSVRDAFNAMAVQHNDSISPIVVVVLGESLRADHLGINGYSRDTTPKLSKEKHLVSFPHSYTEATYTNGALPMLMTRSEYVNDKAGYTEPSFITLFKKAGYRALWLANQYIDAPYAYFAHEGDTVIFHNAARPLNDYRPWLDMELMPDFNKELSRQDSAQLIVIHPIGSHWWYPSHYEKEFARFQPECKHKDIDRTGREELINSYDNTILATDNFLSNIIAALRDKNAVMIYMSDHGESLGENGMYLHGVDSEPVHRPAVLVWYSDEYAKAFPDKISAMLSHKQDTITAGALFHSALDAADLKTDVLKREMSVFSK